MQKKYQLMNESANPNSPENRVLEFCVRTDFESQSDYWGDYSYDSDLEEVTMIIHSIQRDIDKKILAEPFTSDYLIDSFKWRCQKIVKDYNRLQYKRDDNEKKPKNFAKVTLTKKFIVDFCNLIWQKREYLRSIKK